MINFNESELKQINSSIKKFEDYIDTFKTGIINYFEKMNTLKNDYNSIYENDMINNYKIYYINQLNYNDIICEYNNKEYKEIKILNCYEEAKKESRGLEGINNEKEIRENCLLLFNIILNIML